ncbi:MAG: multicomponent Na+:H+ antiporter subunit D [Patiriisocius sp.]|jgi:multicomponent Na+:H+ antiporter subunit D
MMTLILLLLVIPLVTMGAVLALGRYPNIRDAASITGGLVIALTAFQLFGGFEQAAPNTIVLAAPVPGLELAFSLDALGMIFILVASTLWPITTLFAIGYMRGHHEPRQTSFYAWFAFSIACTMAIALSANLFTLFVFYELLTLSTYPLVTHGRNEQAKKGGRTYLIVLLGSSVLFLLPAIIWTWTLTGTLDFVNGGILAGQASTGVLSILLVLFVFGVGKAAIMPIHSWLPAAMVAPTPVSALLHAVAVVKAGVFTILKVVVFIFGLDTLAELPAATWLSYLAAATILIASVVALRADNLKRRLAYSTISQLNYITLGSLLASATALTGSAMHIAMHAFAKITLFFCAGAILVMAHKSKVSELDGLGRSMPITMVAFFVASLGIIGVPPTGGTWSKWLLLTGTFETHEWVLMATLMLSSLLSIAYLLVIPVRAFLLPDPSATGSSKITPEPLSPMIVALSLTAIGTILLFLFPDLVYNLASNIETSK